MGSEIALLQTISDRNAEILGDNLVGIYIHGSFAFQCFNRDESDIDFIVVVNHEISLQSKLSILAVLEDLRSSAPAKGFEMSVVRLQFCQRFEYPTPYELHFSNAVLNQYLENPMELCGSDIKTDVDLAAHFKVIKHTGIVLCGQPISMDFGDIPEKDYLDSIRSDVKNARQDVLYNPVNTVLNLCRVYAYIKDSLILSKEQGGRWGLSHLPARYADLISGAVGSYSRSAPFRIDDKLGVEFCEYMLEKILVQEE